MSKKSIDIFSNLIQSVVKNNTDSNTFIKQNITILSELKKLIPPLSDEEKDKLCESIILEGCRESLIIWDNAGTYILVDGHNRYEICANEKIDFRVEVKDFKDLADVKNWMINNQLGKRNISELVKSYLRGLQYSQEKVNEDFKGNQYTKSAGGQIVHNQKDAGGQIVHDQTDASGQIVPNQKTVEKLALQHQVSAKTIQRDEKFALGLDMLASEDSTLKNKILNREIKVPTAFVQKLGNTKDDENAKEVLLKEFKHKYITIGNHQLRTVSEHQLDMVKKMLINKIKKLSSIEKLRTILAEIDK